MPGRTSCCGRDRMRRILLGVALAVLLSASASAAEVIAKNRATVRKDPSTQHRPIAVLLPGEHVDLLEPTPTNGYYHVRTEEGDEGWVYSRNVQIVPDTPAGPPPAPASAPAS